MKKKNSKNFIKINNLKIIKFIKNYNIDYNKLYLL